MSTVAGTSSSTQGYHTFKASGSQFEVPSKYALIKPIGHGAFGVVVAALDAESGEKVAIKKIARVFEDAIDAKRILREILLMKKFDHENVIRILDIIPPPLGAEEFDDIYIVQDLMETDLHRIIYSPQPLTVDHIQYFVYQILRGLKYIHSANVVHRDLKPSNLLLNGNCDLKICDFGLARALEDEGERTEYVVTRWYRAPEVMLACQDYTKSIDMWSVGCIFAELLARQPLFPGEDYIAQLQLICDKLGRPTDEQLSFVTSERARRFMNSLPDTAPIVMSEMFPAYKDDADMLDLLSKMLEFHPGNRISIEKALEHPFLSSLHNADDEPSADFTFSFDFENEDLPRERVQELIWQELRTYHPQIAVNPPSFTVRKRATAAKFTVGGGASSGAAGEQTVAGIAAAATVRHETAKSEVDDHPEGDAKLLSRKRSMSPPPGSSTPGRSRAPHK